MKFFHVFLSLSLLTLSTLGLPTPQDQDSPPVAPVASPDAPISQENEVAGEPKPNDISEPKPEKPEEISVSPGGEGDLVVPTEVKPDEEKAPEKPVEEDKDSEESEESDESQSEEGDENDLTPNEINTDENKEVTGISLGSSKNPINNEEEVKPTTAKPIAENEESGESDESSYSESDSSSSSSSSESFEDDVKEDKRKPH